MHLAKSASNAIIIEESVWQVYAVDSFTQKIKAVRICGPWRVRHKFAIALALAHMIYGNSLVMMQKQYKGMVRQKMLLI